MKEKAPSSYKQVTDECNEKDRVVAILQAIAYAFCSEVHEQQIRERVDNLRRVLRDYIILQTVSTRFSNAMTFSTNLFTPIERRGDRREEPILFRRVRYRR